MGTNPMRWAASLLLAIAAPASAAMELRIAHDALERTLAKQAFTDEGRLYVRGNRQSGCVYAYLQQPRISGNSGRLVIKARFTGKQAASVFGTCLGVGGDFDVYIVAVPYYSDGALKLREVNIVSDGDDSIYKRHVRQAMQQSLEKQFNYKIEADARALLEQPVTIGGATLTKKVTRFAVPQLRVESNAVVVVGRCGDRREVSHYFQVATSCSLSLSGIAFRPHRTCEFDSPHRAVLE